MKKFISFFLILACLLALTSCNKPEPKLIHKTYKGEVCEITDTIITIIYYGGANREVSFEITDLTIAIPSDLAIGDEVTVEAEYTTDTDEPYPFVMITRNETDTVSFHDKTFNKSDLSAETLEWLEKYNAMSEDEQLAISYIPADLYELCGYREAENGEVNAPTE